MKLQTWTCGVFAGTIATIALTILSLTLFFTGLMPLSISEYAARFILFLDGKEMNTLSWVVGVITNFSLGGLFGILASFLYKLTGPEEKLVKIFAIGVSCWFFQLAIVPALNPHVAKYSTPDLAIPYYILYLIWSYVASYLILSSTGQNR